MKTLDISLNFSVEVPSDVQSDQVFIKLVDGEIQVFQANEAGKVFFEYNKIAATTNFTSEVFFELDENELD